MKGFLIGVLLTIVIVGAGGAYLYETKFKGQPEAGPTTVIELSPASAPVPASAEPTPAPTEVAAAPAAPTAPAASNAAAVARTDHESVSGIGLAVTELKRTSGETVMLKFTMTNTGVVDSYYMSKQHEIELVDAVNKKKYLVVKDSEGNCLCTPNSTAYVKPGSQVSVWAKFPAPPPDVTKISVMIPGFIPMDDVPISQ